MSRRSWNGFGTVICAIDFSKPSRDALRHAAVVAARGRGRLVVLFANDPLLVAAAAAARPRLNLRARSAKELDRFVRTTLGPTALPDVERRVATGEPVDQILSGARAVGADLIVVGSRGLTGVARLAFGSTTTAVLKRSPVPVLVVRANHGAAHRGPLSWPRGRIVAPVILDRRAAGRIGTRSRVNSCMGRGRIVGRHDPGDREPPSDSAPPDVASRPAPLVRVRPRCTGLSDRRPGQRSRSGLPTAMATALIGLSSVEAAARLCRGGVNELPSARPRSVVTIALEVLREPIFLLLMAAGGTYLLLGDAEEAIRSRPMPCSNHPRTCSSTSRS